MQSLFLKNIKM